LPVVEKPWVDFSQGLLHETGSPFDLAISGDGLFAVNSPSGPLYTRNGNFTSTPGGELVTSEGYAVRSAGGTSLQVKPGVPIEVLRDGSVRQDGKEVGRLQIVDFKGASGLAKMGNSYFRHPDPKAVPGAAASFQVHQGKLESSNVGPAESAVRLVSVMRQFEMLQKAVQIGADMDRKAVEEVAHVGS
jgi:flagellar basal body rod protein FlgG